jgi:drug/metabolite transporter (DMT)-like permease
MNKRLQADLSLTFCSLIWGVTFVVVKDALDSASVFVFLALRFVLAASVLALMYRSALPRLNRAALGAGAMMGGFMFAGYACQTIGLQFTTPSKAAFITGSSIVLVPVFLVLFLRQRTSPWMWSGVLAALLGLYYLTVPAAGFGRLNRGDLWTLACAVMFAVHIIVVGRYSRHHSVGALSFLQVATTSALTALAVPLAAAAGWEQPRLAWSGSLVFAILITAVGATAIAFSVQVWAQRYTSPTHTAILFSLEPVFAALTSYVVMRERLGARALTGAALIFAGILITELRGPAPAAAESAAPVSDAPPAN